MPPRSGVGKDDLLVATGHYRNGILLAPVTADLVVEMLESSRVPELAAAFSRTGSHDDYVERRLG